MEIQLCVENLISDYILIKRKIDKIKFENLCLPEFKFKCNIYIFLKVYNN